MALLAFIASLVTLVMQLHFLLGGAATFTIVNGCDYTVWPGILSNAGVSPLSVTGFSLQKGELKAINTPSGWAGRFWGRTLCSTDASNGKFTCLTGDCGSGKLECSGAGATPPATLAEITLDGSGGMDFYDVSLVDGYNLPMLVTPRGGSGPNCSVTGCVVDLNGACPAELRVTSEGGSKGGGSTVACKSACDAFNSPQYCCSQAFGSPDTCKPSSYSVIFKKACPRAYSYAYDDKSSTFTCSGSPDYTVTFCPSPSTSQKASSEGLESPSTASSSSSSSSSDIPPYMNSTMIYQGVLDVSSSALHVPSSLIASGITLLAAIWSLWQLF